LLTVSGVEAHFSASHRDPVTAELHGHSYKVVAYHTYIGQDAVSLQGKLRDVIAAQFDHRTLPATLSTAEAIAAAIMEASGGSCVAVEVSRPLEGLSATVSR
jgi:6-pyruvoyl-tetrahydropterin synthase